MASSSYFSIFTLVFLTTLLSNAAVSHQQQPVLNSAEQDSVYKVLESINPTTPWRTLFPDDLCSSSPYGVVCDYFYNGNNDGVSIDDTPPQPHITELRFGYVSDYTPNPNCSPDSTIDPSLFTSFPYLKKLFFYQCFTTGTRVSIPDIPPDFGSDLEELIFIGNPSLVGPVSGILGNFTYLRRLVLTGNGFYGNLPDVVGTMDNLEEITVSGNQLNGSVLMTFEKLKKLKVLDLNHNDFEGDVPDSIGRLGELLKLDLSYNRFTGKIPQGIKGLQRLELLDLSFNRFGNFGVPLFLGEMSSLREVDLSGNLLGGTLPDIWKNLGGILGLGLSGMGLVGNIPNSIGVHLGKLSYLGLDNNKLEGAVPEELCLLEKLHEVNLENNSLSGKIPFSANFTARVGKKLKLGGNPELCVDADLLRVGGKNSSSLGQLKICKKSDISSHVLFFDGSTPSSSALQLSSNLLIFLLGLLVLFL